MRPVYLFCGLAALLICGTAGSLVALRVSGIATASMEPTLRPSDKVFEVSHYIMGPVSRGEIVEFTLPHDNTKTGFARVLGLPADRVQLHDGRLVLNGKSVVEPYIKITHGGPAYDFPVPSVYRFEVLTGEMQRLQTYMYAELVHDNQLVVPDDQYFVVGDNRYNSVDSRNFGPISKNSIVARPLFVYASGDPSSERRAVHGFSLELN